MREINSLVKVFIEYFAANVRFIWEINAITLSIAMAAVVHITGAWEKSRLKLMKRNREHAPRVRKCILNTVPVMHVQVNVQHSLESSSQPLNGYGDVVDITKSLRFISEI